MTFFLAPAPLELGGTATLAAEEAAHLLKSRRYKAGERFALQDPLGRRYLAELLRAGPHEAQVRAVAPCPVPALPALRLELWMAAVKDKAAELVVQKATELGVAAVTFFQARHTPVAEEDLAAPRTAARFKRIAWEACKQCDRQFPPALDFAPSLAALLPQAAKMGWGWVLDPNGVPAAQAARLPPAAGAETHPVAVSAVLLVGPEGGLTPEELFAARDARLIPVSLGRLTLRAETAALAGCAVALLGA